MEPYSKDPKKPEALKPEPEVYEGFNLPYLGVVDHGVEYTNEVVDPHVVDRTEEAIQYGKPAPDPNPVAVRIVNEGAQEIRAWRVHRYTVSTTPVQILNRNESRTRVFIKNNTASRTLYIAPDSFIATATNGYPIANDDPAQELISEESVWAVADSLTVDVVIREEYTIEV